MKIGIISDTHGILPQDWRQAFYGVDAIVHAGDIGGMHVVRELQEVAPVHAVRGNMDHGPVAEAFPRTDLIELAGHHIYLMHEPHLLDIDPKAAGVDCVVFGHTHLPLVEKRQGVLFVNPGSAGVPKYGSPPTVALLELDGQEARAVVIELGGP